MKSLTNETFVQHTQDGPCVVHFWAAWSGPCFSQEDDLLILEQEFPKIGFFKINCDEEHDLAIRYGIVTVPTVMLVKDGQPVKKIAGLRKLDETRNVLNSL